MKNSLAGMRVLVSLALAATTRRRDRRKRHGRSRRGLGRHGGDGTGLRDRDPRLQRQLHCAHATTASFRDPGLILDSTHVYFLNSDFFDPTALQRTTLDGTTVETLTSFGDISNFALTGDSIVFYDTDSKSLYTLPKAGGTPVVLYKPTAVESALSLAANERFAYWTTSQSIWRVGLDGTGATELLHTTNVVELIAADASGLYASLDTASYNAPAFVVKIAEPN